jgi:transposase
VQVADRFHLLKNVTDSLERFLARKHASLRQAANAVPVPQEGAGPVAAPPEAAGEPPPPVAPPRPRRLTRHEQDHQERRGRRLARYEEVRALHGQGYSLRAIARDTGLSPTTVRRYVQAEGFPECQSRRRRSLLLEPFVAYLRERWDAGCHNAKQLWAEIRQRGYRGGYTRVSDCLRSWRSRPGAVRWAQQAGHAATPPPAPHVHTAPAPAERAGAPGRGPGAAAPSASPGGAHTGGRWHTRGAARSVWPQTP